MTADELEEHNAMLMEGPSDPDAQATVTDFIDYTEYLPSDLVRSLTLIRGLDETYLNASATVHDLTKTYGSLPSIPPESRPEAATLRKKISEHLTRAINARESAYAESCRLYDAVDRHFDRLGGIKSKLDTLLSNFAADVAAKESIAEGKQAADDRKASERAGGPKITLRFDGARQRSEIEGDPTAQKEKKRGASSRTDRGRKSDAANVSAEQPGADDERATAAVATPKKKGAVKKGQKSRTAPSQTGVSRTGATPSGLESSTSHALATLEPPPEDAQPGSEHMPWLRLTDWEMARLRKKMKKNNLWQPSEIMINRELDIRGRGWEGYRAAKANAELAGTKLLDCDDIEKNYVPEKLVRKDEAAAEGTEVDRTKLSNRGMKLNEAKKQKRENLAREQAAAAAAEAEMAARRLGDIGSTFRSLFSSPADQKSPVASVPNGSFAATSSSPSNANGITGKDRTKAKPSSKKRKFEETTAPAVDNSQQQEQQQQQNLESPAPAASSPPKPGSKRLKLSHATNVDEGATEVPAIEATAATPTAKASTAAAGPSGSKKSSPVAPVVESKRTTRRSSIASAKAKPTPTPPRTTRSISRRPSNAAAPGEPAGRELRKKSATPAAGRASQLDHQQQATATIGPTITTGRRGKRPAPGPVTAGQDGGSAVSVGRRKAKPTPRKKKETEQRAGSQPMKDDIRIDEDGVLEEIDPNEPRYCVCGDVSFGTMICCEDNDCDKEWFHIDCVGLSDVPSRTAKWYCPECRKKNNIAAPDGIVRSTGRR